MTDDPQVTDPGLLKWEGQQRELPAEGQHKAVLVHWRYLGHIVWGRDPDPKETVQLIWQLEARRRSGRRHLVSKKYRRSLHPTSNLRRDIEAFLGRQLSLHEEMSGFSLERLIDRPCLLTVSHYRLQTLILPTVAKVTRWPPHEPAFQAEGYVRTEQPTAHWVPPREVSSE